jgi:uncharacterized protein
MHYTRIIKSKIQSSMASSNDIILIYGARQVGKTSLSLELLEEYNNKNPGKGQYFHCESREVQNAFEENSIESMFKLIGDYSFVILDEAQSITDIGWRLKLIADYNVTSKNPIQIIATGSSSFELANKINEPLTGRAELFWMFPLTVREIRQHNSIAKIEDKLSDILVYGLYPSVFDKDLKTKNMEIQKIFNNYLYKDILTFENIKKSTLLKDLTKILALQIGSEISLNSLAQKLNVSIATIERYLNLLEQTFIIYRLRTLNKNSSKEITRNFKIYFYDLGARNFLINNFNDIDSRTDIGELWENFCVIERVKLNVYNSNESLPSNQYFWRTYTQQEIDFVEEKNNVYSAFEFKFSSKKKSKLPIEFSKSYPQNNYTVINSENFTDYLL